MPSSRPSLAACLVLQGESTPPALQDDLQGLVRVADEVVVYDTAAHLQPGSPAFEATLHPAITVVSGFWADDRDRAHEAAMAHVRSDWVLCVQPGEQVEAVRDRLHAELVEAEDAPALTVRVDDVVRGSHRSLRLLHRSGTRSPMEGLAQDGELSELPSDVLTVRQPVEATARLPRQRGLFARV